MKRKPYFRPGFQVHTTSPILTFIIVLIIALVAGCTLPGNTQEFPDKNARMYQMYFDSSGDPAQNELQVRRFMGHLHMADIEGIFGDIHSLPTDENCNFSGGPVFKDGLTWYATVTPDLFGAKLVSVAPDGTKSFAFDLDGDRVVDLLDIRLADNRRYSFLNEALGLDVFKQWLQGQNPFCSSDLMQGLDLPDLGCQAAGGSGGGSNAGGPAADFADPADSICSGYSSGPGATLLGNNPTQADIMYGTHDVGSQRTPGGSLRIEQTTDWFDLATGEFLYTEKTITEYNAAEDSTVVITEVVAADGSGSRAITVTESDGTSTRSTYNFTVSDQDVGQPGYDEAVTEPPSPGAPTEEEEEEANESRDAETDATQGEPGPEGDDSVIAEFCARRANYESGIEQAVKHDPSAISISCGDLVDAPTPNCKILEWAKPEDWRSILEPPSDGSCDSFSDPEKQCEGNTVEDRIRRFLGSTAELWSLDTPDITMCSPLTCDPSNAAQLRSYTAGEVNSACSPSSETPSSSSLRCDAFKDVEFNLVAVEWQAGQPVTFYTKMTGGVPGLEIPITGDKEPVNYSAHWGDYSTDDCKFLPGYPERLYCTMQLPPGYGGTIRPFELYINGCALPVYNSPQAGVPIYNEEPQVGDNGDSSPTVCNLSVALCSAQGRSFDENNCVCVDIQ